MKAATRSEVAIPSGLCTACSLPIDSRHFDDSSIVELPAPGREVTLARFELPPQYCGRLEYFSQFTDAFARDGGAVATPGLVWQLRQNGNPLYPYNGFEHIKNPWGYGSFPVSLRLTDAARVELVARRSGSHTVDPRLDDVHLIGGRIVGRFWYNRGYGGFEARDGA
jgi:hypothetical protein